jgi:isopentenyl diphosphate isomerase/L-lactate dehydrogenase-like FMN-dependent dehydrogenase
VVELIERTVRVLRITMFATGSRDLSALREARLISEP